MKLFTIIFAAMIAIGLMWLLLGRKSEGAIKLQDNKIPTTVNASTEITHEESTFQGSTPVVKMEIVQSSAAQLKPSSPAVQINAGVTNAEDKYAGIVVIKPYDAKNPKTAKTNTPAGKYYKRVGSRLILGQWDGANTFSPINPPQTIDISKSYPISLPYGDLPPKELMSQAYTNSEGKTIEEIFDPKTGTYRVKVSTPRNP